MKIYQSPVISALFLEPLRSKLQTATGITGVPICDGQGCTEFLGFEGGECFDPGPAFLTVQFFAPGATEDPPPCELRVLFNLPAPGSETGTNCTFSTQDPIATCNGGGVWEITCNFSDSACDIFTDLFVDCPTGSDECPFIER